MSKRSQIEEKIFEWKMANLMDDRTAKAIIHYENQKKRNDGNGKIVPILAGFLISLGLLSFVASNWMMYNNYLKLSILIIILVGTYILSDYCYMKKWENMSRGIRLIGIVSLGASMALIGQMFHVQAYNGLLFLIWGMFSFLYYLLDPHRVFMVSTMIILTVGLVMYSLSQEPIQWILLILTVGVATYYYLKLSHVKLIGELYVIYLYILIAIYFQTGHYLSTYWNQFWPFIVISIFYGVSLFIQKGKFESLRRGTLVLGYVVLYAYTIIGFPGEPYIESGEQNILRVVTLSIFFILIIGHIYNYMKEKDAQNLYPLLLFIPIYLLNNQENLPYIGLGMLLSFSLCALILSIRKRNKISYQAAVATFVFTTLSMYFQLAFSYMYKSVFFITAGIVLLIAYFFLKRVGKEWEHEA